jgi:hypothetical protein
MKNINAGNIFTVVFAFMLCCLTLCVINHFLLPFTWTVETKSNNNVEEAILKKANIVYQYDSYRAIDVRLLDRNREINYDEKFIVVNFSLLTETTVVDNNFNTTNFVSQIQLPDRLKIFVDIKKPLIMSLTGYIIDSKVMLALEKIPLIQNIVFDKCDFQHYPLKISLTHHYSTLALSRCTIVGGWVELLDKIDNEVLCIWGIAFSQDDWKNLFSCNFKFKQLQIISTDIPEDAFHEISSLSSLQHVFLSHLKITPKDIVSLAALRDLISLQLVDCNLNGFDKNVWNNHPSLKLLRIVNENVVVYEKNLLDTPIPTQFSQ